MPAGSRRVDIGFRGGQVIAMRVSDAELKLLEKAVGSNGWHEIKGEDGPVRLDLAQVVYVSAETPDPHVGFG